MRALVWVGARRMQMEEVPRPAPAAGEVLIQVAAVGICGSELSGYLGHNSLRKPPLIMGHEFTGSVVAAGPGVEGLAAGDRVTVNPMVPDGTCVMCRNGKENLCLNRTLVGAHRPGAFAEWVAVPARACYQLPSRVSDLAGSLTEPLACAVRAVELGRIAPAAQVLILGAGPMGLFSLAVARLAGASTVVVSDPNPVRRETARAWGATHVVNPLEQDPVGAMAELTDGLGAGTSIDCVGLSSTRTQAVQAVRRGGRVVLLGLHEDETSLTCNHLVRSEVEVVGSFCYTQANFADALRLITHDFLTPDPSWLQERPLANGDDAFAELIDHASATVKVALHP